MPEECVNTSTRNGTLGTHPSLHPPKWESLENVFQKVLSITFLKHFSYFFNKGVQFLILFYAFWAIPHIWCAKGSIATWCIHVLSMEYVLHWVFNFRTAHAGRVSRQNCLQLFLIKLGFHLPLICTTSSLGMRTKHPLCVVNWKGDLQP